MINIDKNQIPNLGITNLEKIGVLFYHEYPSTIVYSNSEKIPFILEWVDTADDGITDIFLLFKTSKKLLDNFLNNSITHRDFILNSIEGYVLCFENEVQNPLNIRFLGKEEVPNSYLPSEKLFFKKDDTVELDKILNFFKIKFKDFYVEEIRGSEISVRKLQHIIKDLTIPTQLEVVKNIAEEQSIQVLNIHLKEGQNVDYGTANTYVLGHVLTAFDDLYRATGLDVLEGVQRGKIVSFNSKKGKTLLPKISTEVFIQQAASFSLFIRPIIQEQQLTLDNSTETDIISERVFSLFMGSEDDGQFKDLFSKYSSFVHKAFVNFLEIIKDNNIEVDYNFYSPFSKHELTKDFNSEKAWIMLEMIKNFANVDEEKFSVKVKFTALNCNTGYYNCEDINGTVYHGYFDKLIKESMHTLNFTDLYDISVERRVTKQAGREEAKIDDLIVSCL